MNVRHELAGIRESFARIGDNVRVGHIVPPGLRARGLSECSARSSRQMKNSLVKRDRPAPLDRIVRPVASESGLDSEALAASKIFRGSAKNFPSG